MSAATKTYQLANVVLSPTGNTVVPSGTLTGYFTIDFDNHDVTDLMIQATSGAGFPATTYIGTPGPSEVCFSTCVNSSTGFNIQNEAATSFLIILLDPQSVQLRLVLETIPEGESYDWLTTIWGGVNPKQRYAPHGDIYIVSPFDVPLPAALPLFITVFAGCGLIAWRRKRKRRSAAIAYPPMIPGGGSCRCTAPSPGM